MNINPYIFRGYDIRGIYEKDIDEKVAERIGKAYGTYILNNGEKNVIVGRDNRKSSLSLQKALIKGIISTGANVVDIGLVTTPIYYFSRCIYNIKPGIMVTASHNPSEYNGFKMSTYSDDRMAGEDLQAFRRLVEKGPFVYGQGIIKSTSPIQEYIETIIQKCKISKKIKVVVDCGNASGGLVAEDILKGIGCEVIPLYCELDGSFPNHHPDPAVIDNMKDLILKVKEVGADLGIGLDGDADRVGIVDETGHVMFGDEIQMVFIKEILSKYKGAKIAVEVKCSQALYEDALRLGGKPFYHRTGNSPLYKTIREMKLPFIGEMSGHIFFADEYYGFDDGMYAACRFVRYLASSGKKCSELLADSNKYYSTNEIMIRSSDIAKFEQVDKIKKYFEEKGNEIIDVDGARIIFKDGWGLIRASNTTPNLTMRCESRTPKGLEKIKEEIELGLKQLEK